MRLHCVPTYDSITCHLRTASLLYINCHCPSKHAVSCSGSCWAALPCLCMQGGAFRCRGASVCAHCAPSSVWPMSKPSDVFVRYSATDTFSSRNNTAVFMGTSLEVHARESTPKHDLADVESNNNTKHATDAAAWLSPSWTKKSSNMDSDTHFCSLHCVKHNTAQPTLCKQSQTYRESKFPLEFITAKLYPAHVALCCNTAGSARRRQEFEVLN
jgi:hypothetical protein